MTRTNLFSGAVAAFAAFSLISNLTACSGDSGSSSSGSSGGSSGSSGTTGDGTGTGPASSLKCTSSNKNAFETYGAHFVDVNEAIFANVGTETTQNQSTNVGDSFTKIGKGAAGTSTHDDANAFKGNLAAFLVFVYGGPRDTKYTDGVTYHGSTHNMVTDHTGLAITSAQYDYFVSNIVVPALKTSGVSDADVGSCFAPPLQDAAFKASVVGHQRMNMRSVKIALGSVVGLGVVLTGLIGFAHTRSGRPLLRLLGRVYQPSAAACPLGYDKVATPEDKEAGRKRFAEQHPATAQVASKPALGFVLDQTRQDEVVAWAKSHQVDCKLTRTGLDLECTNVPAELLPEGLRAVGAEAVWLSFGSASKLISVTTLRRSKAPETISTAFQEFNQTLSKTTGGTPVENGKGTVDELKRGLLSQSSAEFKFHNYYALARATNMGDSFLLTEEYRSLPD